MNFRRSRIDENVRDMLSETTLNIKDFIYPLFVVHGKNIKNEIASMPDVYQMSIDNILKEIEELRTLGIKKILLFGLPKTKDSIGSEALSDEFIVAKCTEAIKEKYKDILVVADLCFCEYTDHGHCGIIDEELKTVDNEATLEISRKQVIVLAKAGVDMIAPSGMMDNIVANLRDELDTKGYSHIPIMSYSTKFASAYYGPFRDVADSTPSFGDRKSYQMNPANRREAIRESVQDEMEGADILMVKPALAYLDIVRDIRENSSLPLAVYNVSGEYSMLKLAGKNNLIDYNKVLMETMISFKRAGADIIISYHTKELARLLKNSI